MTIPARILRAAIRDIPGAKPHFTPREQARFDTAIAAGQRVLARHGRIRVTLQSLASALMLSPATLRRWFCDIDHLLAEILLRHLRAIADALAAIPQDLPDRAAALRAAYLAASRTGEGALTDAHLLLVRDRHHLPSDEIDEIADLRDRIGRQIAGARGGIALGLLDMPELSGDSIATMLTALAAGPQPAAAAPLAPDFRLVPDVHLLQEAPPDAARAPEQAAPTLLPRSAKPVGAFVLKKLLASLPPRPPRPAAISAPASLSGENAPGAQPSAPPAKAFSAEHWTPPSLYDRAIADLAKARA
jgi:AcrR family transcriptional regulator